MRVASCVIRGRIMGYAAISSTSIYRPAVTAHVHWCCMHMVTTCTNAGSMAVARKFPDSTLSCSAPHISGDIRLQVIVCNIAACFSNINNVRVAT